MFSTGHLVADLMSKRPIKYAVKITFLQINILIHLIFLYYPISSLMYDSSKLPNQKDITAVLFDSARGCVTKV